MFLTMPASSTLTSILSRRSSIWVEESPAAVSVATSEPMDVPATAPTGMPLASMLASTATWA